MIKLMCIWNCKIWKIGNHTSFVLFCFFSLTSWINKINLSMWSIHFVAGQGMAENPKRFPFRIATTKSLPPPSFIGMADSVELQQQAANGARNRSPFSAHQELFDVRRRVCGPRLYRVIHCILFGQTHSEQSPSSPSIPGRKENENACWHFFRLLILPFPPYPAHTRGGHLGEFNVSSHLPFLWRKGPINLQTLSKAIFFSLTMFW